MLISYCRIHAERAPAVPHPVRKARFGGRGRIKANRAQAHLAALLNHPLAKKESAVYYLDGMACRSEEGAGVVPMINGGIRGREEWTPPGGGE